jgi:hypothetical protein
MEIQNISWIYVWGRKIDIYLAHKDYINTEWNIVEKFRSRSRTNEHCIELGDFNNLLHNFVLYHRMKVVVCCRPYAY